MKKFIIFLAVYMICLLIIFGIIGSFNTTHYKISHLMNIDRNIIGTKLFKYTSDADFLGDGITLITYKLKSDDIKSLKNYNDWHKNDYNWDKELNLIVYDKKLGNFKFPISGYYLLYDKKDEKYKIAEDYFNEKHMSYNYLLVIIDLENKILIYFEEDT